MSDCFLCECLYENMTAAVPSQPVSLPLPVHTMLHNRNHLHHRSSHSEQVVLPAWAVLPSAAGAPRKSALVPTAIPVQVWGFLYQEPVVIPARFFAFFSGEIQEILNNSGISERFCPFVSISN